MVYVYNFNMVVYVEYVVLDNFIIDLLLLNLTTKIAHIPKTKLRFVSCLIGVIVALISPLIHGIYLILLKILCSMLMIVLVYNKSLKKYILCLVLFFLLTFCFGGACYFLTNLFNINFITKIDGIEHYNFPTGLAILVGYVCYFFIKNIVVHCGKLKLLDNFTYKIKIYDNNKEIICNGYLDSGNLVLDDKNEGIILIDYSTFNKIYPDVKIEDILLKKKINQIKNQSRTTISSIEKKQDVLTFKIEKIEIYSTNILNIHNITCGLSIKPFNKLNCNCILSPYFFKGD